MVQGVSVVVPLDWVALSREISRSWMRAEKRAEEAVLRSRVVKSCPRMVRCMGAGKRSRKSWALTKMRDSTSPMQWLAVAALSASSTK